MARDSAERAALALAGMRRRPTLVKNFFRFLTTKPLGAAGLLLILAMVVTAAFADFMAPYDPYSHHPALTFRPPGAQFLLGSDDYGRDIFSRIIFGSRISLYVGLLSCFVGSTTGALLGLVGGYLGGNVDTAIQRVMDILLALPGLVLALAVVAALGASINNVIIAIAIPLLPRSARVVRSSALSIKETQYIDAARAVGCSHWRIIFSHVLPNCLAPFIVLVTAQLGNAILVESSLSFLGLGTPEPEPSWGLMLSGGGPRFAERAPWMAIFPGVAISLAVFGFNLFGDALRDALDPKLRRA